MASSKQYDVMILSGGFDPVHEGHVAMFKHAKELADIVVVGLNSDAWLTRKKGKPFMNVDTRWTVLSAMKYIDIVATFNDDDGTACDLIKNFMNYVQSFPNPTQYKIAIGNGGDRSGKDKIPSAEALLCEKLGVEMVWGVGGENKANSSSWLIKNVQQ